jgi:hypothetical protein
VKISQSEFPGGYWVKVTAATPMPLGEYALVEPLGKEGINTLVWDFGVNAFAPENAAARKEEPIRADEPPVLQKRKKTAEPQSETGSPLVATYAASWFTFP